MVLCLGSLTLRYDLFGQFIRRDTHLDEVPEEELEEAILDVARRILAPAFE